MSLTHADLRRLLQYLHVRSIFQSVNIACAIVSEAVGAGSPDVRALTPRGAARIHLRT